MQQRIDAINLIVRSHQRDTSRRDNVIRESSLLHLSQFISRRVSPSKRCAASSRDHEACRKRIRHGAEKKCHQKRFEMRTGKPASSVKKESPEQRAARLEKARARQAKRMKNEAREERSRRQEADKIRHQLRRPASLHCPKGVEHSVHRETLKEKLKALRKYPDGCPLGWRTLESQQKKKERLAKDSKRHNTSRLIVKGDNVSNDYFERAIRATETMERVENHLLQFPPDTSDFEHVRSQESHLFRLDKELSAIESKLHLRARGRKRPRWMVTPPAPGTVWHSNDEVQSGAKDVKVQCVRLDGYRAKTWHCHCVSLPLTWRSGASEWKPANCLPGAEFLAPGKAARDKFRLRSPLPPRVRQRLDSLRLPSCEPAKLTCYALECKQPAQSLPLTCACDHSWRCPRETRAFCRGEEPWPLEWAQSAPRLPATA